MARSVELIVARSDWSFPTQALHVQFGKGCPTQSMVSLLDGLDEYGFVLEWL